MDRKPTLGGKCLEEWQQWPFTGLGGESQAARARPPGFFPCPKGRRLKAVLDKSAELTFPPVFAFPILNDPPWLRSANASVALRSSRSPVSPSQRPSSLGIGVSLPANSTAPNSVLHRAVPASRPRSRRSWSASQERTAAGDTTASSELWPISATPFPIRRWATSFAGTGSNRHRDAAKIPPGRISSPPTLPSWQVPTSSRLRCLLGEVSPPTTSYSSSIWNRAGSASPA